MEINVNSYRNGTSVKEEHLYMTGNYYVSMRWENSNEKSVRVKSSDPRAGYIKGVSFHREDSWYCEITAGNDRGRVELYSADSSQSDVSEKEAKIRYERLLEAFAATEFYEKVQ